MGPSNRPRPTLAQALAVLVPGLIITLVSVGRAGDSFAKVETSVPLVPMFALFVGASLFAVGLMMLLVVVVRPLFAKRAADTAAEQARASKTGR
jgi:hypothetical protein